MNQQGPLADKKREGRCSGDYFVFSACEIHFSGFIEAFDSKRILRTLKKGMEVSKIMRLTLQISLSLRDNILLTLQVCFIRSIAHEFI